MRTGNRIKIDIAKSRNNGGAMQNDLGDSDSVAGGDHATRLPPRRLQSTGARFAASA